MERKYIKFLENILWNMSIYSHQITKFRGISFLEIEVTKPLLDNREFHFHFLNIVIFLDIKGTAIPFFDIEWKIMKR